MTDPTQDTPDVPGPEIPALETPSDTTLPDAPASTLGPIGDETARIPVEPEVAWDAPEPSRAMPWEAPATAAPATAEPAGIVPPSGAVPPQGQPPSTPAGGWVGGASADPAASAVPSGVLSAATVGWVLPPPPPLATGNPGWVIASTGVRFGAWFIDLLILGLIVFAGAVAFGIGAAALGVESGIEADSTLTIASVVIGAGLWFVYFVGFWTSEGKATPGMRALQAPGGQCGRREAARDRTGRHPLVRPRATS